VQRGLGGIERDLPPHDERLELKRLRRRHPSLEPPIS
jgi:hypothetical protein